MSNIPGNKIEELAREKLAGKSYSVIRKELVESGMMEEEIRKLIREVDERVLRETITAGGREKARQWYRFGVILAVAGLILSIAFNAGIVFRNLRALVVYSPFFEGILVMIFGKALKRKQPTSSEKSLGAIRKRRPYK
jgi:hypothetical protein